MGDDGPPPSAVSRTGSEAALVDAIEAAFLAVPDRAGLDAAWRASVAPVWERLDADAQEEVGRIYARHLSTLSWSQ